METTTESPVYPSERLRKQLTAVGIPRENQPFSALQKLLPTNLATSQATVVDVDMVAEVLIYLLKKGVVSLPDTETPAPKALSAGTHVCQFYASKEELLDMVIPYVREGLENNEFCFWGIDGIFTNQEASAALGRGVPNYAHYVEKGQIELVRAADWYLSADNIKTPEKVLETWKEKEKNILRKDFKTLRVMVDCSWISGPEQKQLFIDYEHKLTASVRDSRLAALCTYPVHRYSRSDIAAIVNAHQDTLLFKQKDLWRSL